jgi:hypothetical protein
MGAGRGRGLEYRIHGEVLTKTVQDDLLVIIEQGEQRKPGHITNLDLLGPAARRIAFRKNAGARLRDPLGRPD